MRMLPVASAALLAAGLLPALAGPAVAVEEDRQACGDSGQTEYIKDRNLSNALPAISTPQSWKIATGRGVTVAVVDSGIDAGNAHLADATKPGFSLLGDDGRKDVLGHGTSVAGIIAARPLPQTGSVLVGQAPDATLLPVRVYDRSSSERGYEQPRQRPTATGIAQGIQWAADNGADVINVAISASADVPNLSAMREAVQYALKKDIVIVAAAGNSTDGVSTTVPRYPAAFPGVIGVAATNTSMQVDDYSIHGEHVDVAAPGMAVLSTYFDKGDCLIGPDKPYTSYASGFVSGLAAQLREKYPDESNDMIAWRIMTTAQRDELGTKDENAGWGLIKPYDALTVIPDPTRPGPPMPGAPPVKRAVGDSGLAVPQDDVDPLVAVREEATWWGLGAVGFAGLALVLRPWRLARRRD